MGMNDGERLLGDVVSSVIEKVLVEEGGEAHASICRILEDHKLGFSDCYQNPNILNSTLKGVFGDSYLEIVEKIRRELSGLEDDSRSRFATKLGS